ncbi:MAG: hypothetical protein IPK55_11275 [Streptococcus sp.]|jgi:hypothetical protein|nr:hypothetical protein [Streptococcus sp.]
MIVLYAEVPVNSAKVFALSFVDKFYDLFFHVFSKLCLSLFHCAFHFLGKVPSSKKNSTLDDVDFNSLLLPISEIEIEQDNDNNEHNGSEDASYNSKNCCAHSSAKGSSIS